MRLFRSVLFWLHLVAGLFCGVVIAIMSFTGAVLAFEHEIVEWAERDIRRVEAPGTPSPSSASVIPLPLDELLARAREHAAAAADPATTPPRVTGATVSADPRDAVVVAFGRDVPARHVNPYTGEVRVLGTTRTHDFMHLMEDWHRRLAATGEHRDTGRAITGTSNAAFLFLALSGLWLWWPRQWTKRFLRPSLWFTGASGKARDWNWHNVYGFWFLPVLVVLTASGMVISYRWASDLPYRLLGETPPTAAGPAAPATRTHQIEATPGAAKLDYAAVLARLQTEFRAWTSVTLREGLPPRRGAPAEPRAAGDRSPRPYSATLKADDGSPVFASTQVVIHPYSGELLESSGYAEQSPGRKVRTWLRFLHTGQALGWPGQLVAGLACLAGCVLTYTGFALAWRRFLGRRTAEADAR